MDTSENNESCQEGSRRPAPDGCNSCSCDNGIWSCTEMGCLSTRPRARDESECINAIPPLLEQKIEEAYAMNKAAKRQAIDLETARLGVKQMLPTIDLGSGYLKEKNLYKPKMDPFPESIVAVGRAHDIRSEGYHISTGEKDLLRIYETAPGSQQYFLVDVTRDDGFGIDVKSVIEELREPRMLLESEVLAQAGQHDWHVSADNQLVRAVQFSTDEFQDEIRICGCGPFGKRAYAESINSSITPVRNIAIFMLPGTELPSILDEGTFRVEFLRLYFKKIYIPQLGLSCQKPSGV